MNFNKQFAAAYIDMLLKKHKIKVIKWSASSCGYAKYKQRQIKIPAPTNVDRFGVCLHEIKHILDGNKGKRFEQEFACDMYARNILIELGYDTVKWDIRMKWHVLSRIAMAHNRGLNHSSISPAIRTLFKDVDFKKWIGNKVFVGRAYYKSSNPEDIQITVSLNKNEVEMLLNRKGLMIEKSMIDDSTYGNWLVRGNGQDANEFESLSQIIDHYKLAI